MADHRVVVVGGGFAGLTVARRLKRAPVHVTLIDRRNHHLFQPLLYQVATGALSPANIASPLRGILASQQNCEIYLAEVTDFDLDRRKVLLVDGEVPFDSLVVAAGATHSYFGRNDWSTLAPGLKTIEDATEIRSRIYSVFEAAERETDPRVREELLTFVIVGGGPTGVELAGALAEIAHYTLKMEFRHIDPADARIYLVEAAPHILAAYEQVLADRARQSLERLSVNVRRKTKVVEIADDHVVFESEEGRQTIGTRTVLWAAGVQASPLAIKLATASGAEHDRAGRIVVQADMSLPNHPNVFVLGDMATYTHQEGHPLPGVAPVAIQQGKFVANLIQARLTGRQVKPFHYRDPGMMATIGRASAVAKIGRFRISGMTAWLLWLFVHLMSIVQFENRLLVFSQWMWNYLTFDRSARLITGHMIPATRKTPPADPPS